MLGIIGNKFSIGRETYHPFAAELHYFRIEKRHWSICFERIKKAGYRIISTAVPWNVHQDDKKFMDFNGLSDPKKDLVVFLELAREFGFKVILRPGPWVSGQLKNGGLPDFLYRDPKLLARDASGKEIKMKDDFGVDGGYLPSYLHPNFLFHLKTFFKAFIEVTKNYVHPRGPVFMVELDYETSFGGILDPSKADYNPDVLAKYYPEFLEDIHEDIKKLNGRYKEKNEEFEQVEPPKVFTDLEIKDYPKVLDWFRFREYMLNTYLEYIEDIFKAYTVEPLIFRSLYFGSGDLLPAFNLVPEDRAPFLGSNVFSRGNYFDLASKAKFLKHEYGFAFASSFISGSPVIVADQEAVSAGVKENESRFYLAAGLSSGFKGLNQYMFVNRDHWHSAPLNIDGTVTENYPVAKRFNHNITSIGFEDMDFGADIAVVGNRMYNWIQLTESKKDFPYNDKLIRETIGGLCRDLMRLKLSYGIRENRDWTTFKNYKLLIIPSMEVMAERDQEAIVELLKEGVSVILCGVMPKLDEEFKDCQVLANHLRIKTTTDFHIGSIDHKNGSFPAHIYGAIKSTDDAKVKKLVKEDTKIVGVSSSRFKGNFYLFSFDVASGGNHQKLTYLESVLEGEKIVSHLYCSDPSVDLTFQMSDKKGLLSIVAPPPGELSDSFESGEKQVIIKVDLKALGFKSPKIKLVNLFADEEDQSIKTSLKEISEGMAINIKFPDGMLFLLEKR